MIKDSDEEKLYKNLNELYSSFKTAGFNPSFLNKRDFFNYIDSLPQKQWKLRPEARGERTVKPQRFIKRSAPACKIDRLRAGAHAE